MPLASPLLAPNLHSLENSAETSKPKEAAGIPAFWQVSQQEKKVSLVAQHPAL